MPNQKIATCRRCRQVTGQKSKLLNSRGPSRSHSRSLVPDHREIFEMHWHLPTKPTQCQMSGYCVYRELTICDNPKINKGNGDAACHRLRNRTVIETVLVNEQQPDTLTKQPQP